MCSPAPTAGGCEERTKVKGEGRSARTRSKSRHLFDTYSVPVPTRDALRGSKPVATGLRDAIRSILNHSFSPNLASTGIHCLVAEVPLALRNHMFVAASFGVRGADEYLIGFISMVDNFIWRALPLVVSNPS